MVALFLGIVFIAVSVFVIVPAIPFSPAWGEYVLVVLKGSLPILGILAGLIALLVGLADLKDKKAAKREEAVLKAKE